MKFTFYNTCLVDLITGNIINNFIHTHMYVGMNVQ